MTWFTASHTPPEPHLPSGWKALAFEELDSTNAALKRIVEQGSEVAEGLLVWATHQTAGRGRGGRVWSSPPGNVYCSFLVAAPTPAAQAPEVGFVAALAVRDAVLELPRHNAAPPDISFKWPNDVLAAEKKVCGILPEMTTDPDGCTWIVLGIGVNLVPVEVEGALYPVGDLAAHHVDTTPAHALTCLSRALAARLEMWRTEGFAAVLAAWRDCGPQAGSAISVRLPDGVVAGHFAGLAEDGALLMDVGGHQRRLVVGDVMFGGQV